MGWATEPSFLGDRDLAQAPALEAAAQQAYGEAGITTPMDEFDVAEVADATSYQELLAYEGLAHAASGDAMQYNTVVVLRRGEPKPAAQGAVP